MCKAIEDIRAEERAEGREEGLEKGREEGLEKGVLGAISIMYSMNMSDEQIIEKIVSTYDLTRDAAVQYMALAESN